MLQIPSYCRAKIWTVWIMLACPRPLESDSDRSVLPSGETVMVKESGRLILT